MGEGKRDMGKGIGEITHHLQKSKKSTSKKAFG